jgi:hypothetical protein
VQVAGAEEQVRSRAQVLVELIEGDERGPVARMASAPRWGREPWAATPVTVTSVQTNALPPRMKHRWLAAVVDVRYEVAPRWQCGGRVS